MLTPATSLKRLYRNNATAKLLLDHFANRERNRGITHFERMLTILNENENGTTVSRARLREVFRTLERLDYGQFIPGRHGHPTRFIHTKPLLEIAELAQMPPNPRRVKARRRVLARQAREEAERQERRQMRRRAKAAA